MCHELQKALLRTDMGHCNKPGQVPAARGCVRGGHRCGFLKLLSFFALHSGARDDRALQCRHRHIRRPGENVLTSISAAEDARHVTASMRSGAVSRDAVDGARALHWLQAPTCTVSRLFVRLGPAHAVIAPCQSRWRNDA